MKTPKRQNGLPRVVNILNQQHTCWKRKNKIKQLKRTIARLEKEKIRAYHEGHAKGFDAGFAALMF